MKNEDFDIIFGTPIYACSLDLPDISNYVLNLQQTSKSSEMSNVGGWQSKGYREPTDETLKLLWSTLETQSNRYHNQIGLSGSLKIVNLWFNVNTRGNYNWPHTHLGFAQSAVYYVKAPKGGGNLRLINPNHDVAIPAWGSGVNENVIRAANPRDFSIEPQDNMFLAFPAWLHHAVTPSETDEKSGAKD